MDAQLEPGQPTGLRGRFDSTHWSAVVAASQGSEAALQELCQTYWYPLYGFLRSEGNSPSDAEDLVQSFFALLLKDCSKKLASVDRGKGKFRSFLLASLKNCSRDIRDRQNAQKRGGKLIIVPFNLDSAEETYREEPADTRSPDQAYDRRWARAILDAALQELEREMTQAGQGDRYEALSIFLGAKIAVKSHAQVAEKFGTTEGTIRNAVQRLRTRYGELIRKVISQTLSNPTRSSVDQELSYLMEMLDS